MDTSEYYRDFSKKIGETIKYVGLGIIGTCFTILTSDKGIFNTLITNSKKWIALTLILAIIGIVFDYLQTLMGYINSNYLLKNDLEVTDDGIKSCRILGILFFYLKQIAMISGTVILIVILSNII